MAKIPKVKSQKELKEWARSNPGSASPLEIKAEKKRLKEEQAKKVK